jgi:hypothetical protein
MTIDHRAEHVRRHGAAGAEEPLTDSRSDEEVRAGFADPSTPAQDRIAAIGVAASDAGGRGDVVRALLAVLADPADDPAVRRAAQAALGQLSFAAAAFAPYGADYRDALRAAATDPDPELATHALESLTLRQDD